MIGKHMSNLLAGKHIMVTSGGTREYIDDVRVVTNISTGALGAKIAEELYRRGAKVHYIHGQNARMPDLEYGISDGTFNSYPIKTCADLYDGMHALIPAFRMDAVIHSAAVSDFTFKRDGEVKLSSEDEEGFIEYIRKTITRNPKIIQEIKGWRPETILIGFKFTVGLEPPDLIDIAIKSGGKSGCDAVFANDKSMFTDYKEHVGFLINLKKDLKEVFNSHYLYRGKEAIASGISDYLEVALG
jgi:phosphopantothenoylcysteine synthetase/decarboxylase